MQSLAAFIKEENEEDMKDNAMIKEENAVIKVQMDILNKQVVQTMSARVGGNLSWEICCVLNGDMFYLHVRVGSKMTAIIMSVIMSSLS